MIRGFWHVSFTVRDLDAAVKWYTEVLGLEYVRGQTQQNEYTSKLVAFPDAHLKVAQLRVPGQTIPMSRHHIELVEYVSPRGDDIPLDTNRNGVGHWAFMVDDIHAEFDRLTRLGVAGPSRPKRAGLTRMSWKACSSCLRLTASAVMVWASTEVT